MRVASRRSDRAHKGDDDARCDDVDLSTLAEALQDHSYFLTWWFHPTTGRIEEWSDDIAEAIDEEHPEERGFIAITPLHSREGYGDMQDFIARLADRRAQDLLDRAIAGRGAFRRFKNTLLEFPEIREAWFKFRDARMRRRAVEWLADVEAIEPKVAEELADYRDPDLPVFAESPALDAESVAEAVAAKLRELYGARLHSVVLFGSWARGDAHPESDIDLLVVLDDVKSPWDELRRMEPVLWRESFANNTVVTAVPAGRRDLIQKRWPLLRRAAEEGRRIT